MDSKQKDMQTAAIPLSIPEKAGKGPGFIAYANSRVEKLKDEGRYDAATKLKMYLKKFVTYLGKDEIPFKDFDALLVRNYHAWLKNQELGRNTVSLYIRNLKRVYRLAVGEGLAADSHPFKGMDVSYHAKKKECRNRLTPKEVLRLRYLDVSGLRPSAAFARDLFLFAVFAHGMSGRDLFYLTRGSLKGGFLTYTSKVNGKEETVRWNGFLQEIADKYARPGTPYLFPVITSEDPEEQWRQHDAAIHTINRNLKKAGRMIGLSFPLTLTAARHSWECLAGEVRVSELL